MENLVVAHAWVLEHGSDCDGEYTRGNVNAFPTLDLATKYAEESNDWSDGMSYVVTEKWSQVVDYCYDHDMSTERYVYCTLDTEG